MVHAVIYHSGTRRVAVELRDASRLEYVLPLPARRGVRYRGEDAVSHGRTPRISRLIALAIRFERLLSEGAIRNYRELAEVGHVSRPRLTQIMRLAQLAPEIQEQLLFLPCTMQGPDRVVEKQLRYIAGIIDWEKQKELFRALADEP